MKKLSKSQMKELEWILNFYLYEDGLEFSKVDINRIENIKKRLGFKEGNNN